jgi:hypothetical protein
MWHVSSFCVKGGSDAKPQDAPPRFGPAAVSVGIICARTGHRRQTTDDRCGGRFFGRGDAANGHRAAMTYPRPWHLRHSVTPQSTSRGWGWAEVTPVVGRSAARGRGGCPQGDPGTRQPPPIWAIRRTPAAAPSPGTSAIPNAPGGSRKQLAFPTSSYFRS